MRSPTLLCLASLLSVAALLPACAADQEEVTDDSEIRSAHGEGAQCANGTFGTPHLPCASGLVCEYANDTTAPSGPTGSSSAKTGICRRPKAKAGETCGSGVFGTPSIACADGLVCTYAGGTTAPSGPSGSSSAKTGTCRAK